MKKKSNSQLYPCDAICPRCARLFIRNSPDESYCSAECEFELPCNTKRKVGGKTKAMSLDEVIKRLELYRKKIGKCISYGEFIKNGGGKINDQKKT